jgi:hypothetical protein
MAVGWQITLQDHVLKHSPYLSMYLSIFEKGLNQKGYYLSMYIV